MNPPSTPATSRLPGLTDEQGRIVRWIRKAYARREPLNICAMKRRAPEILAAAFRIEPFWGWRRAIQAAGLRYERIPVELEETVRCEVCGHERVSLTAHLWRHHQFEAGEYQEAYPGALVQSEELRARRRLSPGSVAPHWEPFWTREYLLDRVSYYHEIGVPMNHKAVVKRDRPLVATALVHFSSWDDALRAVGIEPERVRLQASSLNLSKEELLRTLREQAAAGLPMNAQAVRAERHGILTASHKHFGGYREAVAAAGLDVEQAYQVKRRGPEDERRLAARARRVAALAPGRKWKAELGRLHREHGNFVQKQYGGWWELARGLGLPPRSLVRREGWDRAAVIEALRERERQGESLRPSDVHVQEKGLYLGVVRYFGTFEDCYDLLGFPRPPVAVLYRRELHDPQALVERIRTTCRAAPGTEVITGTDMIRYTRLAWLARHHFGSWDEGLRRAGLRGVGHLHVLRYADPPTLDADLKRIAEGRLRAGPERRRTLFRYARRIRGSVVGALDAVGASRSRALGVEASPWPEYPSGEAVLAALERRRRRDQPLDFRGLYDGRHQDRALLRAGQFLFGSWVETLQRAAESVGPPRGPATRGVRRDPRSR